MKKYTWKTKEGKILEIDKIDSVYLNNIQIHLEKKYKNNGFPPVYYAIKLEKLFRFYPELKLFVDLYDQLSEAEITQKYINEDHINDDLINEIK